MPHKKRKVRKKRGSRTYGYGRVGQHRGGGQRGGHGKAGLHKHKWSYTLKYAPEHFENRGFKPPRRAKVNVINVGELNEMVSKLLNENKAVKKHGGIYIDLNMLGYDKLLGSGQATHPLILKVASSSKSATEKIRKAKGEILQEKIARAIDLTEVRGIGPKRSEKLKATGIHFVNDLAECNSNDLVGKLGVSKKTASRWIKSARALRK